MQSEPAAAPHATWHVANSGKSFRCELPRLRSAPFFGVVDQTSSPLVLQMVSQPGNPQPRQFPTKPSKKSLSATGMIQPIGHAPLERIMGCSTKSASERLSAQISFVAFCALYIILHLCFVQAPRVPSDTGAETLQSLLSQAIPLAAPRNFPAP